MALKPGDKAPPFALATEKGELSLSALAGKPFVLYFYPKDSTAGCTREAIDFSARRKKFADLGVAVIGISKDSLASHQKFAAKHKLTITLASDPQTETAVAYGVWVEKSLYGKRYMGMERSTFLVDGKGLIHKIWREVKVEGHADAVLAEAATL
jgi:thioredoxin-dependent peroxiredoxin